MTNFDRFVKGPADEKQAGQAAAQRRAARTARIAALQAQARSAQVLERNGFKIGGRKGAKMVGECQRVLESIWREIDRLRAEERREEETKTTADGVTLYRVFNAEGRPVYVSVPEDEEGR